LTFKPTLTDERYLASNDGRVFSTVRNKELSLVNHSAGYLYVSINNKTALVHRLVAEAWLPNPEGYRCVNHVNGDKTNNNVHNLEWCTHSQNNQHAYDTGLKDKKLSDKDKEEIRKQYAFGKHTQRELAKIYGVNQKIIWLALQ
jgi:hypothetical protein